MKRWLTAVVLALFPAIALPQGFPERPVRIIVPLTPGGSPDTIARTVAAGLQGVWTQPVVVENRPGGSQNIGADLVAKSAPDGHTWLLAPDNVFSVNPHLGKPPFDPLTDFVPVTLLARIQFLLVVHPSLPVNSVQELVAYAKSRPGELNHGSSGNGSPQHLGAAMLQLMTGTKMNHVPYKGAAPAVADLLPGRIQVWIGAANTLLPHIKEGKLKLLASSAPARFPNLGDTPTIGESVPGYALDPWLGLFVPAKTPGEVVSRIHGEVVKIVNAPDLKAKLAAQGIMIETNSPAEFARAIREDNARWGKVIKEAGIKGE
ncbi:MAG TPA: tripartite tricarboxylate transporter substrate binding protein [Burkholderiales bacterium]|nr:tripartite tricarboxylate transporter substrate binding protein [Burkholderiales bacterium]